MKAKIDLEKFICSYIKWNNIQDALKDQGLKYCNGEIVEIPQESEDERMRKALIRFFQWFPYDRLNDENLKPEEAIAWLKKQDEQKPVVIIPKFRNGDEIKTDNEESLTITKIDEQGYWSGDLFICNFDEECKWDLVE